MSVEIAGEALKEGLGLRKAHIRVLIRTGWVLLVTAFMLWASGAFAFMGLGSAPFASASEVASLKTDVTGIRLQLLEESLFEVRLKQCKAETLEAKQYYYEKLQEKMNLYYAITQRNWHAPDCREIS